MLTEGVPDEGSLCVTMCDLPHKLELELDLEDSRQLWGSCWQARWEGC